MMRSLIFVFVCGSEAGRKNVRKWIDELLKGEAGEVEDGL